LKRMIKFKYQLERVRGIYHPVADVEFKSRDGEWIRTLLLIDSGADVSLIPLSLGKLLMLESDEEKIQELCGLGQQAVPVIFRKMDIKIGKYVFEAEIGWALIEEVPPLLGRKDIFDLFHINFMQDKKIIEFKWIE